MSKYEAVMFVHKGEYERYPEETTDEAIIRKLASDIVRKMPKEDLLKIFRYSSIHYSRGEQERNKEYMRNIHAEFDPSIVIDDLKYREKISNIFEITDGGHRSYCGLTLIL